MGHSSNYARYLGGSSHYGRQCAASNQMRSDGGVGDLILKMLITLALGLSFWLSYGVMRNDFVVAVERHQSLPGRCVVGLQMARQKKSKARSEMTIHNTPALAG